MVDGRFPSSRSRRLQYRVLRRDGYWRLLGLDSIYERDALVPAIPGDTVRIDAAQLSSFRRSYRLLSWHLTSRGHTVSADLLGDDRPDEVAAFYQREHPGSTALEEICTRGLRGKVAMLVGAGTGIGRAAAHRLAEEGASVAVLDIEEDAAVTTAAEIESGGGCGVALRRQGRQRLLGDRARRRPAPGVLRGEGAVLAWSREIAVEFAHHQITVNTVSPGVIETPINAEVLGIDAVRATMLDAILLERLGQPEDVAAAIAFLASSDADFISGADIVVDGR